MQVLILCDDPLQFTADKDTTRAIMEKGWERGHTLHVADKQDLSWQGAVLVSARSALPGGTDPWIVLGGAVRHLVAEYDAVLVRSDPPVDGAYIRMCQLLLLGGVPVFNDPAALLLHNEKLSALRFSQHMPASIVSSSNDLLTQFRSMHPRGVYKSMDSLGGEGVAQYAETPQGDPGVWTKLRAFTPHNSDQWLMGQAWIEEVMAGDKRVIVIDGVYQGAVIRIPVENEFRGNIHMGGKVEPTELTEAEMAIVAEVSPWLQQEKIVLAGLDLVGGYLTEINITSPTGFREIEAMTDYQPSACLWQAMEAHCETR